MKKVTKNTIVKLYDDQKFVAVKDAMTVEYEGETYVLLNQATVEPWYTDSNGNEVDRYVASAIRMGDPIVKEFGITFTERYMVTWDITNPEAEEHSEACDWDEPYDIEPNGTYEFEEEE